MEIGFTDIYKYKFEDRMIEVKKDTWLRSKMINEIDAIIVTLIEDTQGQLFACMCKIDNDIYYIYCNNEGEAHKVAKTIICYKIILINESILPKDKLTKQRIKKPIKQ